MKVYLDYGATSWMKPDQVFQRMESFYKGNNTNAGRGGYRLALDAGRMIYGTRLLVKSFFNVPLKDHVVFTKNVTEALNVVIKGMVRKGDHVLISSIEHNSVYRTVEHLREQGIIDYDILQVRPDGTFPLDVLKGGIKVNTRLCIVNHASNVSGHIMPVEAIGQICQERDIRFVIDGAQTAGALPIDFPTLNCDAFCFTGHKHLLGPMGTGGFVLRDGLGEKMDTFIDGGTGSFSGDATMPSSLPDRFEAGTLNAIGIAGLSGALEYLLGEDQGQWVQKEKNLHDRLFKGISDIPGIRFYGDMEGDKLPVLSLNIKGIDSGELAGILDQEYGIMTRSGLHCSPLAHSTFSDGNGSIRFSIGHYTTPEEIDYVVDVLNKLANHKVT